MVRSSWETTLLCSESRTPWLLQKIRFRVDQPRQPPVLEAGKLILSHCWHIGCHRFNTKSLLLPAPLKLLQERSEGYLERKTSSFSCWVALRCGSSRIAWKVVGGLRAKDNEGIIGSAFCMSVPPDPTVLKPGGLACNTVITYAYRRSRRPRNCVLHSSSGTQGYGGQRDRRLAGLILELGPLAQRSHLRRRLQETAGFYNEKRGNGKFNVGCLGKKETDLPQCNGPGVPPRSRPTRLYSIA